MSRQDLATASATPAHPPNTHAVLPLHRNAALLQVTGGLDGGAAGTSLRIKPDGTLTRTTNQRGTEQGQLDQVTLDDLIGKARAAQFPTLCLIYSCSRCVDVYSYDVSVQIDGSTYRVEATEAAPGLPLRLKALLEALQSIAIRPLP